MSHITNLETLKDKIMSVDDNTPENEIEDIARQIYDFLHDNQGELSEVVGSNFASISGLYDQRYNAMDVEGEENPVTLDKIKREILNFKMQLRNANNVGGRKNRKTKKSKKSQRKSKKHYRKSKK